MDFVFGVWMKGFLVCVVGFCFLEVFDVGLCFFDLVILVFIVYVDVLLYNEDMVFVWVWE